jgi:hypothetical protein
MIKNILRQVLMAFAITISLWFLMGASLSVAADATVVPGKIVVNHDEWTLTGVGFYYLPDDTATFALNVAEWFMDEESGNFLVYSNDWGLTGTDFANTMIAAGHAWTISTTVPDEDLIQYDAIFVAGPDKPDNAVLIDYVESGGHVYLAGGTGDFVGGAYYEATAWNGFLNHFNLKFHPVEGEPNRYNQVCYGGGFLPVTSTHPIFTEVNNLYYNNGNSVSELDPANSNTDILESYYTHGLFGVFDIAEIEVAIDIKPGSDPNCFNNDGHGVIPVAILGGWHFDVADIDPSTILLEGLQVAIRGKSDKMLAHIEDVNEDGFADLVVQILDVDGVFSEGTTTATVYGELYNGKPILGSDEICIVR